MSAGFGTGIDWMRPWLAPYVERGQYVLQSSDWRATLNMLATEARLHNHCGLPIRFVPQESLPHGTGYEAFISATGCVPTRENLHDFFNALVWLTFPEIKVRLNELQAEAIAKTIALSRDPHVTGGHRGPLRDAATIFDENAALLVVRDADLLNALRLHCWLDVFVAQRDEFQRSCEVWLFGHALMEKLVNPYKAITAHAWPVMVDGAFFDMSPNEKRALLCTTVSHQLVSGLTTSDFTPLPVLGVPGWWGGQDSEYYADPNVFRPRRGSK